MIRGAGPFCAIASLLLLIAGGLIGDAAAAVTAPETPPAHTHVHSHGGSVHVHTHTHVPALPAGSHDGHADRASGCGGAEVDDHHCCCDEHHGEPVRSEAAVRAYRESCPSSAASLPPERPQARAALAAPRLSPRLRASGRPPDHLGHVRTVVLLT